MMGGNSSKKKGSDSPSSSQQVKYSRYAADLSSYETACRLDPDLQIFDTALHARTTRVISSLATGVEVRSLSFDSLREVTECLLEMNQEVVKVILECKKDIWNNEDLSSLVEEYFESSIKTLDFCTALESCLKRARNSQLIIQLAVKNFEEEVQLQNDGNGKKFMKTMEELKKFKEAEEPFNEEFFILFESIHKQQISMLDKLRTRNRKLDEKLKSVKTWRKVSNFLFVATFVSVLIFSVVAAAIAAPPVVTALVGALAVPVGSLGRWCNYLWKGYENALKGRRELISSMQIGTFITIKDMESIRMLVNKLEIEMESLLNAATFALGEEEAVKLAIDEIKKKLEVFVETIEDLGQHADKCSREIKMARTVVLRRIIGHSANARPTADDVLADMFQ